LTHRSDPCSPQSGQPASERLVNLFGRHRWGLHGRKPEHFGIAVPEQVASEIVPFVPDCGGGREIVGEDPRLLYDSAGETISSVMREVMFIPTATLPLQLLRFPDPLRRCPAIQ